MTDPGAGRPGGHQLSTPGLVVLAALAFVVELALFGGAGAVAYGLAGGGAVGWVAAVVTTAVVLVLWGLFVAPQGRLRLGPWPRTAAAVVLVYAVAFGLLRTDHVTWAWLVGVAGLAVVAAQTVLTPSAPEPVERR